MKIIELVKQLNALKKQHGNLDVTLINGDTGHPNTILDAITLHPLNGIGCSDRTKPAYAVAVVTWKR